MATAGELQALADVEQISPLITRVLGQNPGPYTLQGTNTYLLGRRNGPAILLDTGQGEPGYLPLIRSTLKDHYTGISDIILTHHHLDHVLGLEQVLPLLRGDADSGPAGAALLPPPKIHKFKSKDGKEDKETHDILNRLPKGCFTPASDGQPVHELHADQILELSPAGEGGAAGRLRVIPTPGHTDDSASFLLTSSGTTSGQDGGFSDYLFTGDTVLGQGTAVFTDLMALIDSLERCIRIVKGDTRSGNAKLLCGHGPIVEDGVAKMQEYIDHRLQREKQVLDTLAQASSPQSAADLVRSIYGPELPDKLVEAARRGVYLHLEKLEQEGRVRRTKDDGLDSLWEATLRAEAKV